MSAERNAVVYGYVKPINKKWLQAQAKKRKLKVSSTLDLFIDRMRKKTK